jgi:small subunit ribosomal protein S5
MAETIEREPSLTTYEPSQPSGDGIEEIVVRIYRCATVVKGGRRFSFSAMVVVGDRRGRVGVGYAKSVEVPSAVEKGKKVAGRNMIPIKLAGNTIPHRVTGRYGASKVVLVPASPGTGVIAGASVRAVLELAGVHDVLTKSFGSSSPKNLVLAAFDGLKQLMSREDIERLRGVMEIAHITKIAGSHKPRKRRGRGRASGLGKTAGRGSKGAGSRSGWRMRGLQEGGQMPTFRRLPKRGFSNVQFATRYNVVNVGALEERFERDAHVTTESLREVGLIRDARLPVKVLGHGSLSKKLVVDAAKFSASAAEKIKAAGGEARVSA